MRVMGIDPGDKRIGLAISDETGLIANPAGIILHSSRQQDAEAILSRARELGAELLVVGQAFDEDGNQTPAARKAERFASELRLRGNLPVEMIDEYGSTNEAQAAAIEMGLTRKHRKGHRDTIAAVIILQRYLDQNHE